MLIRDRVLRITSSLSNTCWRAAVAPPSLEQLSQAPSGQFQMSDHKIPQIVGGSSVLASALSTWSGAGMGSGMPARCFSAAAAAAAVPAKPLPDSAFVKVHDGNAVEIDGFCSAISVSKALALIYEDLEATGEGLGPKSKLTLSYLQPVPDGSSVGLSAFAITIGKRRFIAKEFVDVSAQLLLCASSAQYVHGPRALAV